METEETLKAWVRQHKVTWELSPWHEMVHGAPRAVGYVLRLYGRHLPGVTASAGGRECAATYDRLRTIALASLPPDTRPTQYGIENFDSSLHMRPEGGWEPEVQLTIQITHRQGYLQPLDECEKRCAQEIQACLKRLGAQANRWSGTLTA